MSDTGLLFGTLRAGDVHVEAFREFTCPELDSDPWLDRESLDRAFQQCFVTSTLDRELASFDLIGWYRVRVSTGSTLSDAEIEFHRRHFDRISDVALIFSPDPTGGQLNFYGRSANAAISAERHVSGAFELANEAPATAPVQIRILPSTNERRPHTPYQVLNSTQLQPSNELISPRIETAPALPSNGHSGAPQLASLRSPPPERHEQPMPGAPRKWFASLSSSYARSALTTLRRALAAAFLRFTVFIKSNRKLSISSAILLVFVGAFASTWLSLQSGLVIVRKAWFRDRTARPLGDLGMQVELQGNTLLVRWDHETEPLQLAKSAVLEIKDGSQQHKLLLTPGEIANGSLLYTPLSHEVTVRLQAFGKGGRATSEIVRVADAAALLSRSKPAPEARLPMTTALRPTVAAQVAHRGNPIPTNQTKSIPHPAPKPSSNRSGAAGTILARAKSTSAADPPVAADPVLRKTTPPTPMPSYVPARPVKQVMPTEFFRENPVDKPVEIDVEVSIDKTGLVVDARPVYDWSSTDRSLVQSAVSAAREWKFQPATNDGSAVSARYTIQFRFRPDFR